MLPSSGTDNHGVHIIYFVMLIVIQHWLVRGIAGFVMGMHSILDKIGFGVEMQERVACYLFRHRRGRCERVVVAG